MARLNHASAASSDQFEAVRSLFGKKHRNRPISPQRTKSDTVDFGYIAGFENQKLSIFIWLYHHPLSTLEMPGASQQSDRSLCSHSYQKPSDGRSDIQTASLSLEPNLKDAAILKRTHQLTR
jgi:hypothetical protein